MNISKRTNFVWPILFVLILVFAGYVLLSSGSKRSQKVYRVGVLCGLNYIAEVADGFKTKMAELGYIEGKNIIYDFHKLNADPAGYDRVCQKFVDDKVDLIFAFPTEPAKAAKKAASKTTIPVVFSHSGMEGSNLVKSVRDPGGNLSGVRWPGPDLIVKRFEFLQQLAPKVKRIYIPYNKNYPVVPPMLEALRPVAASKGVKLVELPVTTVEDLKADLEARKKATDIGIDAILLVPENIMQSPEGWPIISKFAKKYKLPLVGSSDATIKKGSIFTYNVKPLEDGQLAAVITDKILKGTPAGTIPIATPEAYLKLNYKAAQELGLNVPEGLLIRSDEIIH